MSDETLQDVYDQRDTYRMALEEVRDRHYPDESDEDDQVCAQCGFTWPCPDWEAANEALGPSGQESA